MSVDMKIDRAGGKSVLRKLKSGVRGKELEACVASTFEAIDFERPIGGTTVVSDSLRFSPRRRQGGAK